MTGTAGRILIVLLSILFLTTNGFTTEEKGQGTEEEKREAPGQEVKLKPIIVTATRTEESIEEVASSVSVIDAEEIEARKDITVKEILRRVPGLDIISQGGMGRFTSVFIRGARSQDTLVMIDGMEINDPISPDRAFNFADFTTDNIEQVEIVRGSQSTLYGSDSIGGVINIITKRGTGSPKFSLLTEGGSDATFREVLSGNGKIGKWDYSFSGARIDSDGVGRDDDYENNPFSGRMGYQLFDRGSLEFVFRSVDGRVHLDDWDFFNFQSINDPNFIQETNFQLYQLRYNHSLTEAWDTILKIGYYESNRDDEDKPDAREPNFFAKGWYDASIFKVDWQHNYYVGDFDVITAGFEYEKEEGESYYFYRDVDPFWGAYQSESIFPKESVNNKAYYFQNQLKLWDSVFATVGVRLDDHETFGNETTYKLALAYLLRPTGTKFKGTWGTGFKAPTLYQLFAPATPAWYFLGGNPNLSPEESTSFDVGIEQALLDGKMRFSVVYFSNDYDDYIDYYTDPVTFMSTYININKAESDGWELEFSLHPFEALCISANYTYTDTEDKSHGGDLLRRPEDKYSLIVDYDYQDKLHANLGWHYVGKRLDWRTYAGGAIKGERYTRVDLALTYRLHEHLQCYGRIENLLDDDYQEIRGYDAPGVSAFGGIKLSF